MYSCQVTKTANRSAEPEGDKPRLSKRTVTENALKLADADGLDALTIRKLAQHLGVTPMALYWHFRSKEDLLGHALEQFLFAAEMPVQGHRGDAQVVGELPDGQRVEPVGVGELECALGHGALAEPGLVALGLG